MSRPFLIMRKDGVCTYLECHMCPSRGQQDFGRDPQGISEDAHLYVIPHSLLTPFRTLLLRHSEERSDEESRAWDFSATPRNDAGAPRNDVRHLEMTRGREKRSNHVMLNVVETSP